MLLEINNVTNTVNSKYSDINTEIDKLKGDLVNKLNISNSISSDVGSITGIEKVYNLYRNGRFREDGYAFNEPFPTLVNTIPFESGTYTITPLNGCTYAIWNYTSDTSGTIFLYPQSAEGTFSPSGRFVVSVAKDGYTLNPINIGDYIKITKTVPVSYIIDRNKLSDYYNNNGFLPSGSNLDNVTSVSRFLCIGTFENAPTTDSFYLDTFVYGTYNNFRLQIATQYSNVKNRYIRHYDASGNWGEWFNIGTFNNSKSVMCFGDSIYGNTQGDTSIPGYISRLSPLNAKNVGFGGCRMSLHDISGWEWFSMCKLADAIASGNWDNQENSASSTPNLPYYFGNTVNILKNTDFSKVDVITIAYGTNDWSSNVTLLDDESNKLNVNTFGGALRYSLKTILEAYPNIQIIVQSILPRFGDDLTTSDTMVNTQGNTMIDYYNKAKDICKEYHVRFADLYYSVDFNQYTKEYYFADGVHLSENGRKVIAEKMIKEI